MRDEKTQLLDQYYGVGEPIESLPEFWGPGLKHCIIVGISSDIAQGIRERLIKAGWTVSGTGRDYIIPADRWDMCIVAQGSMRPIGKFFDCRQEEWEDSIYVNALLPLHVLRRLWPNRKHGAKVVFMSGPNPNVDTPTYTAYRAGKSLLQSLIGTLNAEYPDTKFLWFIPGVVKTRIHHQTMEAGDRAANLDRAKAIIDGSHPCRSMEDVYQRFTELVA